MKNFHFIFLIFIAFIGCSPLRRQPTSSMVVRTKINGPQVSANFLKEHQGGIRSEGSWTKIALDARMTDVPLDLATRSIVSKAAVPAVVVSKEIIELLPTKIKVKDKKVARWTGSLFPTIYFVTIPIYETVVKQVKKTVDVIVVPPIPEVRLDQVTGTLWTKTAAGIINELVDVEARARTNFIPTGVKFDITKDKQLFIEVVGNLDLMIDVKSDNLDTRIKGLYQCTIKGLKISSAGVVDVTDSGEIVLQGFKSDISTESLCVPPGFNLGAMYNAAIGPANKLAEAVFSKAIHYALRGKVTDAIEEKSGGQILKPCDLSTPISLGANDWLVPNIKSYHFNTSQLDSSFTLNASFRFRPQILYEVEKPKIQCRELRVDANRGIADSTFLWLQMTLSREYLSQGITEEMNKKLSQASPRQAMIDTTIVVARNNRLSAVVKFKDGYPVTGEANFSVRFGLDGKNQKFRYYLNNVGSKTNKPLADFGLSVLEFPLLAFINLKYSKTVELSEEQDIIDLMARLGNLNEELDGGRLTGSLSRFQIINVKGGKRSNAIDLIVSLSGVIDLEIDRF